MTTPSDQQRRIDTEAVPPPTCQAPPQAVRDWLRSPCGMPNHHEQTVAEYWELDQFDEDHSDLTTVVEQAQKVGVFGLPDHTITAWYIDDEEDPGLDGFLITVDTPSGQRFASQWLPYHTLIASDLTGIDAVVHTLRQLASVVNDTLAPPVADTAGARHDGPRPAEVDASLLRAVRGFPPAVSAAGATRPPTPPPGAAQIGPAQPGHHR